MLTSWNEPNSFHCVRSSVANSGSQAGNGARAIDTRNNQGPCNRTGCRAKTGYDTAARGDSGCDDA